MERVGERADARAAAHGFGDVAVAQIDKRMAHGGVAEHANAQRADAAFGREQNIARAQIAGLDKR